MGRFSIGISVEAELGTEGVGYKGNANALGRGRGWGNGALKDSITFIISYGATKDIRCHGS
jgi:hypothetical protein